MDRELSTEFLQKQKFKNYGRIMVVVIVVAFFFFLFRMFITPTVKRSVLHTALAEEGAIVATLTASGTVIPEFEQVLISPISSKIDSVFYRAGEQITQGTRIIAINKELLLNDYYRLTDELNLKINKKAQLNLSMQRQLINLHTQLDIKKLQIKSLKTGQDQKKRLYDIGAGNKNALEKANLDLEIGKRELIQLSDQILNQQRSLEADLTELDLEINIQKKNLGELGRQLDLADARAVKPGVITWVNEDIGAFVTKGEVLARIADLNSFKIEAKISDMHASKLVQGNPVGVRINETDLEGYISNIKPAIENGIISFTIKLKDKNHASLRPHLRVDVFVITSSKDNVVRVKNGPFVNGSGLQDIFVINGDKAFRKTVTIGATNFDYVELKDQIKAGDEIIISNMQEYDHLTEIGLTE